MKLLIYITAQLLMLSMVSISQTTICNLILSNCDTLSNAFLDSLYSDRIYITHDKEIRSPAIDDISEIIVIKESTFWKSGGICFAIEAVGGAILGFASY